MLINFPYVFSKNYVEFLYWLSSRKKKCDVYLLQQFFQMEC